MPLNKIVYNLTGRTAKGMKITIENVSKTYNEKKILDIPYLEFKSKETIGIVGNNGAGKTTLLRLLLDIIKPDTGKILINEQAIHKRNDWKYYCASFIDDSFLIPFLTPEEYFKFIANSYNISNDKLETRLLKFQAFFNSEIFGKNKFIRDYSQGNKNKVGIAGALIAEPKILILDEPFANIDPSGQIVMIDIIKKTATINDNNICILSSHNLNHIADICNKIIILEKGVIIENLIPNIGILKKLENYFTK